MITFQLQVYDSTTENAVVGAGVSMNVSWGSSLYGEKAGSTPFTGTTDGQGYFSIQLSDIGFGDTPYTITGKVFATNYYTSNFVYAQINGNADGHQITKVVHLSEANPLNTSPGPTNPQQTYANFFSGLTASKLSSGSSQSMIVWIIALVIMISVIIIIFLMRSKMGAGPSKPRAVIY